MGSKISTCTLELWSVSVGLGTIFAMALSFSSCSCISPPVCYLTICWFTQMSCHCFLSVLLSVRWFLNIRYLLLLFKNRCVYLHFQPNNRDVSWPLDLLPAGPILHPVENKWYKGGSDIWHTHEDTFMPPEAKYFEIMHTLLFSRFQLQVQAVGTKASEFCTNLKLDWMKIFA